MRLAPEMEITTRTQLRAFLRFHAASFKFGGAMQLINIGQQLTMTSREIADLTGKDHRHVMRDIRTLEDQLGFLFDGSVQYWTHPQNGQEYPEYKLGKDICLTLLTGYDAVARLKVVKRWQELEAKQAPKLPDFTNPAESARAWALEFEEKQKAQAALALAAPKVEFFDKVVERGTLMTASQVGQKFKMAAVTLNKNLEAFNVYNKGIKRGRVFQQWFIDKGYGELKQTELGHSQALFTTAGEAWIIEKLTGEGVI